MYRIFCCCILSLLLTLGLPGGFTQRLPMAIAAESVPSMQPTTPLFENLGEYHHPISTSVPLTQRYFDQGFILTYGFNHAEAARLFREAARLDPNCAMCYWGIALVLGPNINAGMDTEVVPEAWQALQNAIALSPQASDKEQAYIQALAKRYSLDPNADRAALNAAYADAMREVRDRYPDDLDAATLYAEALMDKSPWQYWTPEGEPKPETQELLATLDSILEKNPNHPGANHLYIHTVEASPYPERGIPSADRLANLVPGSGHLVHMPSHIYIRVGRYHDAAIANQKAIKVDQDYLSKCHEQGIYPLAYIPHNHHFLWASASLEGQSQLAIESARHIAAMVDKTMMRKPEYASLQHFYSIPLYTLTRFGQWDEILEEPAPAEDLKYPTGVWHYARGMAFIGKGQLLEAAQELEQLQAIATDSSLENLKIWEINSTYSLLQIASQVLGGELAAKQGDYENAIAQLQTAVNLEDQLNYDEPETWYYPVRQSLGTVLLAANQPIAAEQVYREELQEHPNNGWSLFGLAQSLQAQGKTEQAQSVQKDFDQAWKYADVTLTASHF
jgi:tetratricopeptide (TPR) repeat protein